MKMISKITLAICIFAALAFATPNTTPDKKPIVVVIDAGHGGHDDGLKIDHYAEKKIVEAIAYKIKELNTNNNIVIHLTRTEDQFVSLDNRAKFINDLKPDLVLSLHVNGNPNKEISGLEFYVSPQNKAFAQSKKIAELLNNQFVSKHHFNSKGVKEANLMVLKNSFAPAVTFEMGYLSNDNDLKYLTNEVQHEAIANAILEVIAQL